MKDQVLYLFDPLCGWCFGFSSTIVKFRDLHPELEFKAIPGGMITGARVAPYNTMQGYIMGAKDRLETMTGSVFGSGYINNIVPSEILMDSTPPSKALIALELSGVSSIDAAHAIQQAHFVNGNDYNSVSIYTEIAKEFSVSKRDFSELLSSVEMDLGVKESFEWVKKAGVNGFPTVLLHSQQQYYLVARGYTPLDRLNENLQSARNAIVAK